jgi:hypothetical protein
VEIGEATSGRLLAQSEGPIPHRSQLRGQPRLLEFHFDNRLTVWAKVCSAFPFNLARQGQGTINDRRTPQLKSECKNGMSDSRFVSLAAVRKLPMNGKYSAIISLGTRRLVWTKAEYIVIIEKADRESSGGRVAAASLGFARCYTEKAIAMGQSWLRRATLSLRPILPAVAVSLCSRR